MPNPFLEERISVNIRYGATWSDRYLVENIKTANGNEYPRLIHPFPAREFTISLRATTDEMWTQILNLYHRAYGSYAGFRAKCLDDFTTNANGTGATTHMDQSTVTLTTKTFQLIKAYGAGGTPLGIGLPYRKLFKPVTGTVKVGVAGVNQTSGWTVDTATGIITFTNAPVGAVTAGCEFDIPVRFATQITANMMAPSFREFASIDLVERLNP